MELDPDRTAVLALHWLTDIVTASGAFGPFFAEMVDRTGVVGHTADVLAAARRAGVSVVYTRVCFRPGYPDLLVNNPLLALVEEKGALVDGHPGAEIIAELEPQPGDVVVDHRRLTAFHGTDLATVLRRRAVDTLLLTGVATNVTVEGTAREAVNDGFRTVVLADCCTAATPAAHEASLETLGLLAHVAAGHDVLAALGPGSGS